MTARAGIIGGMLTRFWFEEQISALVFLIEFAYGEFLSNLTFRRKDHGALILVLLEQNGSSVVFQQNHNRQGERRNVV